MNSDRIANRITDLLKLTGVKESHALEELTDHYLSHIEEEVVRGVNSQKAIRETYQEIANLDTSYFEEEKNSHSKKGLFIFFLIFIGLALYIFKEQDVKPFIETNQNKIEEISETAPPSGSPVFQSKLLVSSEFGKRIHPISKQEALHKGIDIRAKIGTPVMSTGNGIVKEAGFKSKAGNYIIIQHEGNFHTKYYHLSDISVQLNDVVKEGQKIGKVGNSGKSFMPHLHYEVLKGDIHLNPRAFIKP